MHRWTLLGLLLCLVLLPCLILPSPLPAEGDRLYSWLDQRGVQHYSQLPPTDAVEYKALRASSDGQTLDIPAPPPPSSKTAKSAEAPQPCDDLLRDEYQYRRHLIEDRYRFNRLQCELQDINKPKRLELASCYAKQARWRKEQYAELSYLDACR